MILSKWSMLILILVFSLVIGSVGCGEQATTGPATASGAPSQPTVISTIAGDVSVLKAGNTTWSKASPGMVLEPGDRIKTGAGSNAIITFFEGSTIELAADTEISVSELGIAERTDSTIIRLWQQIGKTRNRVEKLVDPASRYEIETPAGTAVVRGSLGDVEVDRDGTTKVTNIQGRWCVIAQGEEVCIPQGYYIIIVPRQAPGTPAPLPPPPVLLPPQQPSQVRPTPRLSQPPPSQFPSAYPSSSQFVGQLAGLTQMRIWIQTTVSDFNSGISDNVQVVDVGLGNGTVTLVQHKTEGGTCYYPIGSLESSSHDCGHSADFGIISWNSEAPSSTELKFQLATNNDNATWNFVGPGGSAATYYTSNGASIWSGHDGDRYIKYKAYLSTTDCNQTPKLKEVRITYR